MKGRWQHIRPHSFEDVEHLQVHIEDVEHLQVHIEDVEHLHFLILYHIEDVT